MMQSEAIEKQLSELCDHLGGRLDRGCGLWRECLRDVGIRQI